MIGIALALSLLFQGGPAAAPAARPGVVAGQILIRAGVPAAAVRVSAIPAPPPEARPEEGTQYYETRPPVATALTNAQGRYRLQNVPPGRYYIVGSMLGQATYYPAATEAFRATIVTVGSDAAMEGLDMTLLLPLGGRVRGRVTPAPSAATSEIAVLSGVKLQQIVEMPVEADGSFEFGYVPKGTYLLSLFPTPPGMPSRVFQVGDEDVANLDFVRPTLRTVTGRVVVQKGPIPNAHLAFTTDQSYVGAPINSDGTFTARLQPARHLTDMGGMPVGYSVVSVKLGDQDVSQGLVVGNTDLSGVVVTVAAPQSLPRVRGQIASAAMARLASATAEMTGPIVGHLEVPVEKDGSFEFGAVTPGAYVLRIPQAPDLATAYVVVRSGDTDIQVAPLGR